MEYPCDRILKKGAIAKPTSHFKTLPEGKMVQTPVKSETLSLLVPRELRLQVSDEQFAELAILNRDLRLEKTATGELIVSPPTGWETGESNVKFSTRLCIWWEESGEPGKVFDSSTGFRLPSGAIRSPDAFWVSAERWNALTPEQKGTFANICPDFVVELRSRSDTRATLQAKMREYLENGAKLGWLIDPYAREVEIYRLNRDVKILNHPTQVSAADILPGFLLNLERIWGE